MESLPTWVKVIGFVLGTGIGGGVWTLFARWLGLWTTAQTNFQDNLLARVNKLEGRLEQTRDDQKHLKDKVRRLETENAQLRSLLRRFHEENNQLREELGREPVPFEEIDNLVDFSIFKRNP